MPERRIDLEGQSNFRDLGGYATADGRTVRWGTVYRSGALRDPSERDAARLAALGIKTVIDLRSDAEVTAFGRPYVPPGARALALPVSSSDLTRILPAVFAGDFSLLRPDLLVRVNRELVLAAAPAFAELLRVAADPASRSLVFHCTQGKDRTGLGAAILLSALGVRWDDVVADYLLSNRYREAENARYLGMIAAQTAQAKGIRVEDVDLAPIRPLFYVEAAAIDAAREAVVETHGGMEAYVAAALGFGDRELAALRDALLE